MIVDVDPEDMPPGSPEWIIAGPFDDEHVGELVDLRNIETGAVSRHKVIVVRDSVATIRV